MSDFRAERKLRAEHYRLQSRLATAYAEAAETPQAREEFLKVATEWLKLAEETESLPH